MKTAFTFFLSAFLFTTMVAQNQVSTFPDGEPDDAIAIDSNGNIYASGFDSGTIYKFEPDGTMTEFVTGLTNPNGIAFDSNDNLYVSVFGQNEIHRYDVNGNLDATQFITGNPSGMIKAWDNDDMIYTRYGGNTIHRITPTGVITPVCTAPELNGPVGLAYDEFGELYVGNYNNREIYHVDSSGNLTYIATVGNFSSLGFIAYGQGMLWGTVLGEHKIYRINPDATDDVVRYAGSVVGTMDGPISVATFSGPNGIIFNDAEDTIYVTGYGSKNLRVISDVILNTNVFEDHIYELVAAPNPMTDELKLEGQLPSAGEVSISITDIHGKELLNRQISIADQIFGETFNVSSWSGGIYFVTVTSEEFKTTLKVVK